MNTGYVLGIARGHNGGVCLLKDGEIVFSIEEERLSRQKYDGGPYAGMIKVKEYTDRINALIICHTQSLSETAGTVDFTGDNIYTGIARKLGLIDRKTNIYNHPQVHDVSDLHHKMHAACAFYRSGFEDAAAVVVDGAGTGQKGDIGNIPVIAWETESIFTCSYEDGIKTNYKHYGTRDSCPTVVNNNIPSDRFNESGTHTEIISDHAGIVKVYEATTEYCGFQAIEAGKTMGLFPYGKPNENIPALFDKNSLFPLSNRNAVIPTYPNSAIINSGNYSELTTKDDIYDLSKNQNRRDLAYAAQKETQEQVLDLILTASKITGKNNIVLSGGYGLNCVANYSYLDKLKEHDINLYVEPISNDAGTAIGAALYYYYSSNPVLENSNIDNSTLYLGPKYNFTEKEIEGKVKEYNGQVEDADNGKIIDLITNKNIVGFFQGRSENGPRALGNRSLIFDPRYKDGKDFVNEVKKREYFRPFAGSVLEEHAAEYFDLKQLDSSPYMMYAVNVKDKTKQLTPSIVHIDNTCRIQTVSKKENELYYEFIKDFYKQTGCPIVFNTSFNLGGEPLVETLDDALWTLQNSAIEYLYLPEYKKLVTVYNWHIT